MDLPLKGTALVRRCHPVIDARVIQRRPVAPRLSLRPRPLSAAGTDRQMASSQRAKRRIWPFGYPPSGPFPRLGSKSRLQRKLAPSRAERARAQEWRGAGSRSAQAGPGRVRGGSRGPRRGFAFCDRTNESRESAVKRRERALARRERGVLLRERALARLQTAQHPPKDSITRPRRAGPDRPRRRAIAHVGGASSRAGRPCQRVATRSPPAESRSH